ncbi:GPALPP1 isoform 7 [Pan troglodytes]|uniref:GPALPP1 isoform 7 n=1 Tax=Pan troglodytes TaxID=9598 RepID=A0A2J8ML63_PANTR|nr:GPALPP1 isoform 7 [Pan troglodytes]
MARDLIGPALPPGFKARGTAEDEERDPSPGKRRRLRCPPGPSTPSLAGPCSLKKVGGLGGRRSGEWARRDPRELFSSQIVAGGRRLGDPPRNEVWRGLAS